LSTADAFSRHQASVDFALKSGDPGTIKGVYVEFGELLEACAASDEAPPVLSLPETEPVVTGMLVGVDGVLLDAGCGPNPALSIALAGPNRTMVAMDIGTATVRLARAVAARSGAAILGVVGDLEALPFRRGAFDGGVCDDTIEHLPHDALGVAELARVLAPGGTLVVATPNRCRIDVLAAKWRDRMAGRRRPPADYYAASSHLREYTWNDLRRLVRPCLRIRREAVVGWSGGWKAAVATRLASVGPLRRYSRMVVVAVAPRRLGN
jgi:SAM-dependent methyltransferase